MPTTPNLNLVLPLPTVTLGPEWAEQLNEAFDKIDVHDHSAGNGVKITPAGLNINTELNYNSNNLSNVRSLKLITHASPLAAVGDIRNIYVSGGNLYYNNNSGIPVQLTDGNNVTFGTSATRANGWGAVEVGSTGKTIGAADPETMFLVNTSSPRTFVLPPCGDVPAGRMYIFKDATGGAGTNRIRVERAGADTIEGLNVDNRDIQGAFSVLYFMSDGASNWSIL